MLATSPIGIFDSGIGGLSVAKAIMQALPAERLLYFGDAAHLPYGQRSLSEVRAFSMAITKALLDKQCKVIVVACNTASGAALGALRENYPGTLFVGMEPAVKPAAELTRSGVVGVIATTATFQSEVYASVVERFGRNVEVIHQACPGLVERIESGDLDGPVTEAMLRGWLEPMLARNIDALVLGCTHYPLAEPLIKKIVGTDVRVIDPAPAIARQVQRILEQNSLVLGGRERGTLECYTSGEVGLFRGMLDRMGLSGTHVERAQWTRQGTLSLP